MRNKALSGKRIVCLGGTSGIGLATAKADQREGAKFLIASSKRQRVDSAIKSLRGDAEAFVVDLLDETLVQDLFKRIGSFDHLVYTAGETLQLDMLDALQIDRAREFRSCCCSQAGKSGGSCNCMRNQSPRRA